MFYNLVILLFRVYYKLFYRVEVKGSVDLKDTGFLICSNHRSNFDPILIAIKMKQRIYFLGKKELFKNKFVSFILSKLGCMPIDRDNVDMYTLKIAIGILKNKNALCVFPEGTRSKTGELLEFKRGAGLLASRANVPIIPIKIEGSYKLFSKITIKIGEPFYITRENKRTVMSDLREIIKQM